MEPKLIIIGYILVIIIVIASGWILINNLMPTTIPYFSCQLDIDCIAGEKCQGNKCISVGCIGIGGTIPGAISPQFREHMAVQCCSGLTQIDWPLNYNADCEIDMMQMAPFKLGSGDYTCGVKFTVVEEPLSDDDEDSHCHMEFTVPIAYIKEHKTVEANA